MQYSSEEIGKIIKEQRLKLNWSQTKLGDKIGVTGKQISNYENGALFPPIDILFKLCPIFDCELGFLIGEDDYSSGTKINTAIENELGLNTKSIDNIKHITGNQKSCVNFGYESENYREIINQFISSSDFPDLIESLLDLKRIANEKESINSTLENSFGKDILDQAFLYYKSKTDYYHVDESDALPDIYYKAMNAIDKAIDDDREYAYKIKVLRYEAKESFERLLDSLFPVQKNI